MGSGEDEMFAEGMLTGMGAAAWALDRQSANNTAKKSSKEKRCAFIPILNTMFLRTPAQSQEFVGKRPKRPSRFPYSSRSAKPGVFELECSEPASGDLTHPAISGHSGILNATSAID
jgi:hypothetical protein